MIVDKETQEIYFRTFLFTQHGKQVLCDLMNEAGMFNLIESNSPVEQLVLSNFVKKILAKCGIDKPMAVMDAYAAIAENWREPRPIPQPGPLETDKTLI